MMNRRRTAKRGARPARAWADVSAQFAGSLLAVTTAVPLLQLQAPANLSNLTSDPPEDLTLLRIVGTYGVAITAGLGRWTLALIVADVTWTPGATVATDNDKRILWQKQFWSNFSLTTSEGWAPPGNYLQGTTTVSGVHPSTITVDIAPKVKVESGKALYLVAYEDLNGSTLTFSSTSMRVLYQRSGRR